jgi:hypothetical protein
MDCIKNGCKGDACPLFCRPNDCSIKLIAMSVERVAVVLERIVELVEVSENED